MARHPFDAISAALGVIAVVVGILVMTDSVDRIDADGGWWLAVGALVLGLGLIPWSRRGRRELSDTPDLGGNRLGIRDDSRPDTNPAQMGEFP